LVVAILVVMIVAVFAGRNIWHAGKLENEEQTGVKERNGLN